MKKRIVPLLLSSLLMVTATLGACSSKETGTEGGSGSSDDKGSVTLSLMASQDWVFDAEMNLGKDFEKETGIKIDYQIVPSDQYYNLLMTKLNSGEGPDIFCGQSGTYDLASQYNVEKNAVDLSGESWVSTYDKFAKEQTSSNGKLYGATYFDTTTDYYLVYNKKIFSDNGLTTPTSFSEFESVCQKLKDKGITPVYEPAGDIWHHVLWFCEIGGKYEELIPGIVDKLNKNEVKFADVKEFKEALDETKDLASKGYFGDNYLSDQFSDLPSVMGSGEYAMTICKPGSIAEIVKASDGAYKEEDFDMILIPTLDNDILNVHPCGPSRFIYSGSKHIDEAKKYLDYITKKDSVQYMIDNESKIENLPYEVGQTPAYSETTKKFLASFEKSGQVFQDSIKYLNPQWMDVGQDMVSMFNGDMSSEDVLKQIDERRATQAQAASDEAWK